MPKFNTVQEEAQWLDRMVDFLQEDANFLQGKHAGVRWAEKKITNYRAIAEYLADAGSQMDADADEDDEKLKPLSGHLDDEVPF